MSERIRDLKVERIAAEATETGQAVAQRRILHPSAAVLAQSRLVL